MSLVNQMLQELDKRGQANPVLAAAVPYGVNASAPEPGRPVAARSRKVVFAMSALAAAIVAAWYWPSQQAAQGDAPATQQVASGQSQQAPTIAIASVATPKAPIDAVASRQVQAVPKVAVASPPSLAPVVAPVAPPAKSAPQPRRADANKAPAKQARSSKQETQRRTPATKVAAATDPVPKGLTASAATAQPNLPPTPPTPRPSPPAPATAIAAEPAKAGETDARADAAPARAATPNASPEPAARPNKNHVVASDVQRQTRQTPALDSADAAYREGLARFNSGDSAQAVRSFRAALAENPRHRRATEALAAVHVERREWDAALATLRDALAIDPKQPSLAMVAARLLARNGDREAAVQTLGAAVDETSPADAHAALAALLGELKRDREAVPHWLAALKKLPDRAVWWLGLAVALETDRRPADARAAYERAIALGGLRSDSADFARTRIYALR
jgi:MSHA biogenesis protein MshN